MTDPGDDDRLTLFVDHVQDAVIAAASRPLSPKVFSQWLTDAARITSKRTVDELHYGGYYPRRQLVDIATGTASEADRPTHRWPTP